MKSGGYQIFRQYSCTTFRTVIARAEARGDEPKDMTKRSRPMEPLASFDKEGKLTWNEKLVKSIEELAKDKGKGGSSAKGGAGRQNKARPR